jgi:hypothetical protein
VFEAGLRSARLTHKHGSGSCFMKKRYNVKRTILLILVLGLVVILTFARMFRANRGFHLHSDTHHGQQR